MWGTMGYRVTPLGHTCRPADMAPPPVLYTPPTPSPHTSAPPNHHLPTPDPPLRPPTAFVLGYEMAYRSLLREMLALMRPGGRDTLLLATTHLPIASKPGGTNQATFVDMLNQVVRKVAAGPQEGVALLDASLLLGEGEACGGGGGTPRIRGEGAPPGCSY